MTKWGCHLVKILQNAILIKFFMCEGKINAKPGWLDNGNIMYGNYACWMRQVAAQELRFNFSGILLVCTNTPAITNLSMCHPKIIVVGHDGIHCMKKFQRDPSAIGRLFNGCLKWPCVSLAYLISHN